jgi:hypothetical protein
LSARYDIIEKVARFAKVSADDMVLMFILSVGTPQGAVSASPDLPLPQLRPPELVTVAGRILRFYREILRCSSAIAVH